MSWKALESHSPREDAMQEGHPFLTELLDFDRARQRLLLRQLDANIVYSALDKQPWSPAVREEDRGVLEVELRRIADGYFDRLEVEEGPEFFRRMAEETAGEALKRFLIDAREQSTRSAAFGEREPLTSEFEAVIGGAGGEAISDSAHKLLAELAVALVWADVAAGDYVDPRFTSQYPGLLSQIASKVTALSRSAETSE
jgi:hypothetical protein